MTAAQTVAARPNADGGGKWPVIALTARLIIRAKVEVAELGAAWAMA
jgi:hypothetical protein